MNERKQIGFRLDPHRAKLLADAANKHRCSPHEMSKRIVLEYLDNTPIEGMIQTAFSDQKTEIKSLLSTEREKVIAEVEQLLTANLDAIHHGMGILGASLSDQNGNSGQSPKELAQKYYDVISGQHRLRLHG